MGRRCTTRSAIVSLEVPRPRDGWRRGELPFWNQYIFSGTPLLAGFNAGALHPLVGFFPTLPDRVAWIATEVVLSFLIAVGMYLFLRALAAVTFSFSGVVLSQVNHVDMTEGFVSIPFNATSTRQLRPQSLPAASFPQQSSRSSTKIGNGVCGAKTSNLKKCVIDAGNASGGGTATAPISLKAPTGKPKR